jgi:hypothetical protein
MIISVFDFYLSYKIFTIQYIFINGKIGEILWKLFVAGLVTRISIYEKLYFKKHVTYTVLIYLYCILLQIIFTIQKENK